MTIKEIIDAEKRSWRRGGSVSCMLDRIESAVTAYVAELEADKCIGPDCNKPRLWRGLGFENTTVTTGGFTARIAELADLLVDSGERIKKQSASIAELEEQNLNMMALFRDFYELGFNRDECREIIKKYGGEA